ncbi:MAG: hypothetical protein JWO38_5844 [Gemmataceae bacterium]|nr:hypothetical protein [Gemmataceae bacterium]
MSVRVSCPYCNTGFTLPELPPTGRATCPRCGDSFPVRGRVEEQEPAGPAAQPPDTQHPSLSTRRSQRARRSVARAVGIGLAMGLVGIGIGLAVVYVRGGFRHPAPEPEPGPSATATPPTELRGLGYLPPGSNIVVAVQPGPVLAYAARTNQDPRELLIKAGVPASVLATLDRLGITLPQVDHIVAGALIPDADLREFRLSVALVLRHPLADEDRFLDQLKAHRVSQGGKTRYKVELAGLQWWLTRASETAWVFGWTEKDLDPAENGGKTQLAAGLREMLGEKLPADAAVWAAADSARWAEKKPVEVLLELAGGKKDWLAVLNKGQAAVAGLTFDPPRLRVFVRCSDADTGEKVRAYFAKKATGDGVRVGGAGEWAMLDTPGDPQTGFAALKGFLDDAGK